MPGQLVFPGDEIAAAEEFIPGEGTFEERGTVYAAWIGTLELDTSEFVARVVPHTTVPCVLRQRDIVIGRVRALKPSFAAVDVVARADSPDRAVAGETNGTLHISKVARAYLEDISEALQLGDLIRAEVLEADPAVQLSTRDEHLGVVKSYCPRCRNEMRAAGQGLVCPECDWRSRSKIAGDYGSGLLLPEGM